MSQWMFCPGPFYECPNCDYGDYSPRHNCPMTYKTDRRQNGCIIYHNVETPKKSIPQPATPEQKKPFFNQTLFDDLHQELVTLTGGLDRQGRHLLVFRLKMQLLNYRYTKEKITSCLRFIMGLPECICNTEGFTAVLDRMSNKLHVELVVNCLRNVLKDKLKLILVVQPMDENNTFDGKFNHSVNDKDPKGKMIGIDTPMNNLELTEKQKTVRAIQKSKTELTENNKTLTFLKPFCDNWDVYFDNTGNRTVFKQTGTQFLSQAPPRFHRNIQQGLSTRKQEPNKTSLTRNETFGGERLKQTSNNSNDSEKVIKNQEISTTKHQAEQTISTKQLKTLIPNDNRATFPIYIPLWKLGEYVQQDQLPPALCGTMEYYHEKWLNDRKQLMQIY